MALDPRSPFSHNHPLAGKITAGVRTTENRVRLPHQSMQLAEMPTITMADRAQQMFSMTDMKGTRVYYSNQGVFNTVDEQGKNINFIKGLFKTNNRQVIRFLQQFVDSNNIHYLELQEDPSDAITPKVLTDEHERSQGSGSSSPGPLQQHPAESERREEPAPEADRSGPGGEDTADTEQPVLRPTIRSESSDRDDSPEQGRQDNSVGPGQPAVVASAPPLSLSERMKARR